MKKSITICLSSSQGQYYNVIRYEVNNNNTKIYRICSAVGYFRITVTINVSILFKRSVKTSILIIDSLDLK